LEIEGERLAGELRSLKAQYEGLEREGVEGSGSEDRGGAQSEASEDEIVLKLRVYRSLGIDAEQDPATGEFNKVVVRNAAKGDATVVHIDPKLGRSFYAGHFWNSI